MPEAVFRMSQRGDCVSLNRELRNDSLHSPERTLVKLEAGHQARGRNLANSLAIQNNLAVEFT